MSITQPLKWHGGKAYLAANIIGLFPPRCRNPNKPAPDDKGWLHYVEPYAGGLAVLLANDPEGISEVANDLNGDLTIFWRVIASEQHFADFLRRVQAVPFSEAEWELPPQAEMQHGKTDPYLSAVETASRFFIRCRQSLAGRMKGFTGVTKTRTRRGMNNEVSAWLTCVEGLPAVHERLKRVLILNRPALDVIRGQDGPQTLFYIDAPYVHSSRATTGEYEHEMTDDQHRDLINVLRTIKGRAVVSMYHHEIYDVLHFKYGWRLVECDLPNNSAGGVTKRRMTECLWMNYPSSIV